MLEAALANEGKALGGIMALRVVAKKHLHCVSAALEVLSDTLRWMQTIASTAVDDVQLFEVGDGIPPLCMCVSLSLLHPVVIMRAEELKTSSFSLMLVL